MFGLFCWLSSQHVNVVNYSRAIKVSHDLHPFFNSVGADKHFYNGYKSVRYSLAMGKTVKPQKERFRKA